MGDHGAGEAGHRSGRILTGRQDADVSHKTVAGGDGRRSESGYPALESEAFIAPGGLIRKTFCQ
jgi:hypothetical protein